MRTWGGRFSGETDARVADFTRSIEVDAALAADDIAGSIAHVRGLGRAGILSADDVQTLVDGLTALAEDVAAGRLEWDGSLEDVHMNIEAALAAKVGPLAGRLHTGRSRNDQVATDLRLWTRRAIDELFVALLDFEGALVTLAERDGTAVLPGTTHIQPAQPILFAHHLLAYVEMAERDRGRLADARERVNVSPLGSGALAGAGYPLDREATAAELGFDGVSANSLDAVSDRDFVVETIAAVALGMVHLSRLAEEITWWSNPAFGFVRVADAFSTGSSMMPNKKNPDPAELVRGRAARVIGELTGALTLLKGLPLAYQRDLQESVAPLFDAVEVFETSLRVMTGLVETLTVDAEQDAGGGRRGLHDRDGRRRRVGPTRHPVPCRPPRRRRAGRGGREGRDRAGCRLRTRRSRSALAGSDDPTAAALAERTRDRRRTQGGRLDRRRARLVRRHRRDRTGSGRSRARRGEGAPRPA